jgi:muconate cycloisomerase
MRVTRLTVFHVRIPLKHRVRHASHVREETDSLVVRCELDDGTIGWGEGLPRPYVTGETIDRAWSLLGESDLERQLGEPFGSLTQAMVLADRLALKMPDCECPFVDRGCFGNSARCAIELSLLDAAARAEDVPLSRITELLPEAFAIRESQSQVRYSAAITALSPWKTAVRAWKIRLYGFQQCKVKVGMPDVSEVGLLRRVRRILPESRVDLRLDVNEAWTCDELESKVQPLLPFGITSLEQPVPHREVAGLAALRGRLGVPLMLDESLCCLTDAYRAIEAGTCDLFNIRLSKCGGFLPSLRLAAVAHQAGLGYQLGCQVGETGILSAAGRHFATSVASIRYLEGSYDRHLVRERLTQQDLTFGRGGLAPAVRQPGLGVTIDEAALRRVTRRELAIVLR